MALLDWVGPSLLGLIAGTLLSSAVAIWIAASAGDSRRRGYMNAIAVGLLLAAAIEVIPSALSTLELFLARLLAVTLRPEADTFLAFLVHPASVQIVVRAFGAATVMVLFFRGNARPFQSEPARSEEQPRAYQWDAVALISVVAGLFFYNLWMGEIRGALLRPGAENLFLVLALIVFSGALLGVAVLGHMPAARGQWWLPVAASLLLGLGVSLGIAWPEGRATLIAGLLPLVLGAGSLVYGIGRLLRLLQGDIGLGWRTTATVAIGALVLYQSRILLLSLI